MSHDPLAEATRALRETETASDFEARATRTRVITGLHQTRVRRRTRLAFLLPVAASLVAVSAWGAASGQGRRALDKLERLVGITAGATAPSHAKKTARRPAAPPAVATNSPEQELLPPSHEAEAAEATPIAARAASSARVTASASSSASRADRADPTLSLYRAAHTAHFVDRDPTRAVAAWDAYLSAAPNGEFAPEARYNRALSLVRLGRSNEARSALMPFANGAYGGYRKAEASALLERLEP